jgi:two-component system phosphate regulon response regulator PhoB
MELEKLGYEVEIAYDGPEGIEAVKIFNPSIIVLDCNLPKLSGVEVCRKLKSEPESRTIPVVMFSAENKLAQMTSAYSAGADFYVTKDREGSSSLPRLVEAVFQRSSRRLNRA